LTNVSLLKKSIKPVNFKKLQHIMLTWLVLSFVTMYLL